MSGCGGSGTDRAGGEGTTETVVLTLAQPNDTPPSQLVSYAGEVAARSDGTLKIEFANGWRLGESDAEIGTINDVQAGDADLAWVGARVFDRVGVTSFQPLLAPMLVDSLDLEQAVFEAGVPKQMLQSLGTIDLAGIGVLPGPMRKLLGVEKAYTSPGDFAGSVVGIGTSDLAASTMSVLGATPQDLPSGAELDGLDAMDQQLASIVGNRYWDGAGFVTADLNLWPRPLVLVMNADRFDSLSDEQRGVLTEAADNAFDNAMNDSRDEDTISPNTLCEHGMALVVAGDEALAALRTAVQPVYAEIAASPANADWLDQITSIKESLGARPDTAKCDDLATTEVGAADGFPGGTYQATITAQDYTDFGLEPDATGVFTMVFDRDQFSVLQPTTNEAGFAGTYSVFRDRVEMTDGVDTVSANWSLDGNRLVFTSVLPAGSPFELLMAAHPWTPTKQQPVAGQFPEGTLTTSITQQDAADRCGLSSYDDRELELTIADGQVVLREAVAGGELDVGFVASYEVFRDRVEFTEPGVAGTLAFEWTFDGEHLTLSNLEDDHGECEHHVVWESHPFTLAATGDSTADGSAEDLPLHGTYQWTITDDDAIAHGTVGDSSPEALAEVFPNTFTIRLDGERWEMEETSSSDTGEGTFEVFHDTVTFTWSDRTELSFTYSSDDDGNLTLVPQGSMQEGDVFIWTTKQWVLISA